MITAAICYQAIICQHKLLILTVKLKWYINNEQEAYNKSYSNTFIAHRKKIPNDDIPVLALKNTYQSLIYTINIKIELDPEQF